MKLTFTSALHELPKDMKVILESDDTLTERWNALTDIARNEWICWVTIYKKQETRNKHLEKGKKIYLLGKKDLVAGQDAPIETQKQQNIFLNAYNYFI